MSLSFALARALRALQHGRGRAAQARRRALERMGLAPRAELERLRARVDLAAGRLARLREGR